jgi:enoyl-CoA hydratase/carnithine racemase
VTLHINHPQPGIAVLTFDRPEALNALNLATMNTLSEAVDRLHQQAESLRVVIVTGSGEKSFSSGGDLQELGRHPDEAAARDFITLMGNALLKLERLPVPVIAAVNGYALGGGTEIALACDLRVVDEAVSFGLVQLKMALTPGWGAGQRLLRLVGYTKAMQLLIDATPLKAAEVYALGLANKVAPAGEAYPVALEWATQIAYTSPEVVRGIKTLLQAGLNQPYETALQIERDLFPPLWAAEPHLQAVERFLQRKSK